MKNKYKKKTKFLENNTYNQQITKQIKIYIYKKYIYIYTKTYLKQYETRKQRKKKHVKQQQNLYANKTKQKKYIYI